MWEQAQQFNLMFRGQDGTMWRYYINTMKLIKLKTRVPKTRSFAIVDDDDYEKINKHEWYMDSNGYATRGKRISRGVWRGKIMMHREILQTPEGLYTDHINGDGLDNRKCNLRIATAAQNIANAKKPKTNSSGFKGVNKCGNGWQARIMVNGKRIFLGYCKTPEAAFELYKNYGQLHKGEYFRME